MARSTNLIHAQGTRRPLWAAGALIVFCIALWGSKLPAQFSRDQSVGRTVRLVLHPWGFEPSEVTIAPGPVGIEVRNKVGFPELDLSFELEQGEGQPKVNVLQERFFREQPKWRNVFVLNAGTYVVSVAPHEKWVARIIVKDDGAKQ